MAVADFSGLLDGFLFGVVAVDMSVCLLTALVLAILAL
jgi:hypothetical protein